MADHQHCINCLEAAEGLYSYPCQQCGWSPDQYSETGLYLSPGTILNSQYQIARMLGHGGFGITYLAWDNLLQRRLAIKEYMPRDFATRNTANTTISVFAGEAGENFAYGLERFLDEARTLAKFQQHAGIVSVLNVFYANSTGYMVMEYVDGRTLKDYLTEQGPLTWEQTLHLFMPVMDALREVHKNGVMHRDISPDNIYLCHDKRIKLLDFGAARNALGGHSHSLSVVVKPGYAPEEQYRAKGKQGPWTDVYSVAASMYRCITGVVPPDALDRLDEDELVDPSALGVQISQKAEAALLSALAVKANERTQSIEAFQQAIWDQAINSEPVTPKTDASKKVFQSNTTTKEALITIELADNFLVDSGMSKNNLTLGRCINRLIFLLVDSGFFKNDLSYYLPIDRIKKVIRIAFRFIKKIFKLIVVIFVLWFIVGVISEFSKEGVRREKLEQASENVNEQSTFDQGLAFYDKKDYVNAFAYFSKSAALGHAQAQNWLGFMYVTGLGVSQDDQQAFYWCKQAAEQGLASAQESLGVLYDTGTGVKKNKAEAIKWYRLAAEQGNADAIADLQRFGVK